MLILCWVVCFYVTHARRQSGLLFLFWHLCFGQVKRHGGRLFCSVSIPEQLLACQALGQPLRRAARLLQEREPARPWGSPAEAPLWTRRELVIWPHGRAGWGAPVGLLVEVGDFLQAVLWCMSTYLWFSMVPIFLLVWFGFRFSKVSKLPEVPKLS